MNPEQSEEHLSTLIDVHLRFLRGRGPEPDLTDLGEEDRAEVAQVLKLIEVLADSLPESPPMEEDPVAIQLGLGEVGDHQALDIQIPDPVVKDVEDLCSGFGGAVRMDVLANGASNGIRDNLVCHSLAEMVIVTVLDASDLPQNSRDALTIFTDHPEVTAVAFSSPDASRATVVTYSQSVGHLIPAGGQIASRELEWEPLGIALGRYLERSIPRWEEVRLLPPDDNLDPLVVDVSGVVASELTGVARLRPRLPHKQEARNFVAQIENSLISGWVEAARSGEFSQDALIADIVASCEVSES